VDEIVIISPERCLALVYDALQHSRHTLARHTGIGLEGKLAVTSLAKSIAHS
jgi:hypothetical protein